MLTVANLTETNALVLSRASTIFKESDYAEIYIWPIGTVELVIRASARTGAGLSRQTN